MTRLALFKMYNQAGGAAGGPGPGPHHPGGPLGGLASQAAGLEIAGRAMAEQHARALQAVREAEESKAKAEANEARAEEAKAAAAAAAAAAAVAATKAPRRVSGDTVSDTDRHRDDDLSPPPMKRERHHSGGAVGANTAAVADSGKHNGQPSPVVGGANIRIANRGEIIC